MALLRYAPVGLRGWIAVFESGFRLGALGLVFVAWVTPPAWGLPEVAPSATPPPGVFSQGQPAKSSSSLRHSRAQKPPATRAPRSNRVSASPQPLAREFALPRLAPRYDAKGRYLPTIYIYQETNGGFRILGATEPKAQPAAGLTGAAPAQQSVPPGAQAPALTPPQGAPAQTPAQQSTTPEGGSTSGGKAPAGNPAPTEGGSREP